MPAIMTHDFFGRDAYNAVDALLGFGGADERDAFLLGNQGPDPLFYLVADPRVDKSMRLGDLMHHERPALLLASLHDAVALLPAQERPVGQAYAAGFVCHYLLDATAHPLVFATQYAICQAGIDGLDESDGSKVHAEIERDLDEMVLFDKTGKTVRDYRPYREVLQASDRVLDIVDKLYFHTCLWTYGKTLDANVYLRAVEAFRLVQRLFWAPTDAWRESLGAVERRVTRARYSLFCAMAHRPRASRISAFDNHHHEPWTNPFTGATSTESFWDLYEDALSRVFDTVVAFGLRDFDTAAASVLTGGLNFSGAPASDAAPTGHAEE